MTLSASNINWTDYIWPVVEGCTNISPGCLNCWAGEYVGGRLARAEEVRAAVKPVPERFRGLTVVRDGRHVFNGVVRFQQQLLDAPLRHSKPGRVFVAPRGDLFHESVTDEQIAAVFGVMAACPHLTFQVLTKRAERLPRWFEWAKREAAHRAWGDPVALCLGEAAKSIGRHATLRRGLREWLSWPLPNVHVGVTVDDRKHGRPRIDHLRQIPAAVRWLSVEPMLEAIDLSDVFRIRQGDGSMWSCWQRNQTPIDWIVCGGESGQRARPFALEWADDVRRQCAAAGVPFWMKQAGSRAYVENLNYWPDAWISTVRQRPAPEGVTAAGAVGLRLRHPHGEDLDELPEALRVREWPRVGG